MRLGASARRREGWGLTADAERAQDVCSEVGVTPYGPEADSLRLAAGKRRKRVGSGSCGVFRVGRDLVREGVQGVVGREFMRTV